MKQEDIQNFQRVLEGRCGELRERLEKGRETTDPVAPDRAIGRLTRQEAMQAQQVSPELQRNLQLQMQQTEQALARIEDWTFGGCLACQEEIGRRRLEARPEARLCIRCADRASNR